MSPASTACFLISTNQITLWFSLNEILFYVLYISIGTAIPPWVVCIVLALEGMETDMMMIDLKADMETEMMTGMAMGEKENGVPETMIDMVGMENHMAVRGTGMVEIMRSGMAEMGTGMMTTEEEVKALMIIIMGQEVEVPIEIGILQMRMMANILPGFFNSFISTSKSNSMVNFVDLIFLGI